jgi:tRNA G37 N-methylase Trm5
MYEQIGKIAIISARGKTLKELKKKARELLKIKSIETVLLREKVKGRLRKARYRLLAGKRQFETLHRENKCMFKLDVRETYFSSRLGNNRLWTAKKILEIAKKKKLKRPSILVMFSGIGVYGIVIARLLKDNGIDYSITAVEINRKAVKYAKENVKLNRLDGIEILQGDVRKVLQRLAKLGKAKYDFIVMPRPRLKYDFFREAFINAKRKSVVFYFDFVKESELAEEEKRIVDKAKQLGKRIRILEIKKAGEIGVRQYRVVVVFEIL